MPDQVIGYLHVELGAHNIDPLLLKLNIQEKLKSCTKVVLISGSMVGSGALEELRKALGGELVVTVETDTEVRRELEAKTVFDLFGKLKKEKDSSLLLLAKEIDFYGSPRKEKPERTYSRIPQKNNRRNK